MSGIDRARSPVIQTAFAGAYVVQGTMQRGLSALHGRFDGDFGETVVQPRGAREHGQVDESANFGVNDAGVDRVHRHTGP